MDGNGVGPTGSVHVSSKILPKDNSKSFMMAVSVLSSFTFTCKAFLDNVIHTTCEVDMSHGISEDFPINLSRIVMKAYSKASGMVPKI